MLDSPAVPGCLERVEVDQLFITRNVTRQTSCLVPKESHTP